MNKTAITASVAAAGILASVLGQQAHTSAAASDNSGLAEHYVLAAHVVTPVPAATTPTPRAGGTSTYAAGTNAPTIINFSVNTTGALTITVPNSAYFGSYNALGSSVTGSVGTITVTDTRAAANVNWNVYAELTDITTTAGGTVIPASSVTYNPGPPTVTVGTVTVTPSTTSFTGANVPVKVLNATGSGSNTVTWNPTLSFVIPTTAVTGDYTGTLTHSVI